MALPKLPNDLKDQLKYQFKDDEISVRASTKGLSWAPIELAVNAFSSWPSMSREDFLKAMRFVNVETGEVVAHPGLAPLQEDSPSATDVPEAVKALENATSDKPLWLDANGRFLVERRTLLRDAIRQIDWFDPRTKESGVIPIPRSHESRDYDAMPKFLHTLEFSTVLGFPTQLVSPDGTTVFELSQPDEEHAVIRMFDLHTQAWHEQRVTLEAPTSALDFHISPSADKVAICRTEPEFVDVYETESGQLIESVEGSMTRFPGQWHAPPDLYFVASDPVVLDIDGSRSLITKFADPTIFVEDQSGVIWEERETELSIADMVFTLDFEATSAPQFTHGGGSGIVQSTRERCPGLLERCFQPLASALGFSLPIESHIGTAIVWTNWQTDQRVAFRCESADEDLSGSFAVRPNCVCLLTNPSGPNPRVEVWNTPPPQRPVLAIWIVSLLVTVATWFWLRRRKQQASKTQPVAA